MKQDLQIQSEELKQANEDLKIAKQVAEEALLVKSSFLSNMTHEVRTPITGIIAATDLALSEEIPPKVIQYLQIIQSSTYNLLNLISNILDYTEMDSGSIQFKETPFFLDDIIGEVIKNLRKFSIENQVELIIDMDIDMRRSLIGDSERLQQIILNLLNNAIKFSNKQGFAQLTVMPEPDCVYTNSIINIEFIVENQGIGISEDKLIHIFTPFSQLDSSSTKKYEGAGLGLAITKKLVDLMNGRIWVKNTPDHGTVFYVVLPFLLQGQAEKENGIRFPDSQKYHILFVDNHSQVLDVWKHRFDKHPFRVSIANSGKKALDKLKKQVTEHDHVDLVVIDDIMPELTGFEVASYIRKGLKLDIPIILLETMGMSKKANELLKTSIDAILIKPVNPITLRKTIISVLYNHKQQGQHITHGTSNTIDNVNINPLSNGNARLALEHLKKIIEQADPIAIQNSLNNVKQLIKDNTLYHIENQLIEYEYEEALNLIKELEKKLE